MRLVDEESSNHLFIHCSFSMRVWTALLIRFRMNRVMPHTVVDLFKQWHLKCSLNWKKDFVDSFLVRQPLEVTASKK